MVIIWREKVKKSTERKRIARMINDCNALFTAGLITAVKCDGLKKSLYTALRKMK